MRGEPSEGLARGGRPESSRALWALALGATGLPVTTMSLKAIAALDLAERWGRVPAGCFELDHCGLSSLWTVAFLLVVVGVPVAAHTAAGWRLAAPTARRFIARALVLLAGTLAYHGALQVVSLLVAYR